MRSSQSRRLAGRRPSPSMVVAIIALVMAMGGTATAAKLLVTSSKQIRNGAVTGADIRDGSVSSRDLRPNAVTGGQVRDGSVALEDLEGPARAAIIDAGTQALEAFRLQGPQNVEAGKQEVVATLTGIPAGTYAIFAKTVLTPGEAKSGLFGQGGSMSGHCQLDAGADVDHARALLGAPGANSPGMLTLQLTRTFSQPASAALSCDVEPASWSATNTSIIAIRVGRAPRQSVDG